MSKSAVITVGTFHLYLPNSGEPQAVAALLSAVTPGYGKYTGAIMVDLIAAVSPKIRAQLEHEEPESDYEYTVVWSVGGYTQVVVTKAGSQLFAGDIQKFTKWAAGLNKLENMIFKQVEFKYNGGSDVGGLRRVHVEDVGNDGNNQYIAGYDLSKTGESLKRAYRRYFCDRINGEIKILD